MLPLNFEGFFGTKLSKVSVVIALLVSLVGAIACPFMSNHPGEIKPFHSYLFHISGSKLNINNLQFPHQHEGHTPLNKSSQDNSAASDSAGAVSVHNYDSLSSNGVVIVSGSAAMAHIDLLYFHPGSLLEAHEPRPMHPQNIVSLPDKPPPFPPI